MGSSKDIAISLRSFVGARLLSVSALYHVFDLEKDSIAQELELSFSAGLARIYGGSDGASICFSWDPLKEVDLDGYGHLKIYSVSEEKVFCDSIGKDLSSVSFVRSARGDIVIGVSFSFKGAAGFSVLNLGDDLFVFDVIPEQIAREEGVFFEAIK